MSEGVIVLVRFLILIVAAYFIYEAFVDYTNGYVIRRGIQYTLEDNPRSFYISIIKDVFIGIVCFFVSLFSFSSDSEDSKSDSEQS